MCMYVYMRSAPWRRLLSIYSSCTCTARAPRCQCVHTESLHVCAHVFVHVGIAIGDMKHTRQRGCVRACVRACVRVCIHTFQNLVSVGFRAHNLTMDVCRLKRESDGPHIANVARYVHV